jgi:GxxExxY protein
LPTKYTKDTKDTKEKMARIIFKEESYKIIGACFEVYKNKGCGFTEPVYQECLSIEFALQRIPFVSQPVLELEYKGSPLVQFFKPDFICYNKILVEIKALEKLVDAHRSQALNYLNATNLELALLINFGHFPKVEYERIAGARVELTERTIREEIQSWELDRI